MHDSLISCLFKFVISKILGEYMKNTPIFTLAKNPHFGYKKNSDQEIKKIKIVTRK